MRLVRLSLSNIRSYGPDPTVVEFSNGITLFCGDIGSGKSTLLAALEFGLFGLGDLRNTHLLRHRAPRGYVEVTFSAGGVEHTVHRTLVRSPKKGDVRQTEGWIEAEGIRTEYSTTELKARVLALLGFNERPDPKAGSRIYRYAVYTPQEEMKQVLLLGREERLDIVRRAFGLDQYRHARRNVEEHLVRGVIAPQREVLAGITVALPVIVEEEDSIAADVARLAEERVGADEAIAMLASEERRLSDLAAPFAGARASFERARGELASLERVIAADEAEAAGLRDVLEGLDRESESGGEDEEQFARLHREYARWEALVGERSTLRESAAEFHALEDRAWRLEGAIEQERQRLEGRLDVLRARLAAGDPANILASLDEEEDGIEAEERALEVALAPEAEIVEEVALCNQLRGQALANLSAAGEERERVRTVWEALAAYGAGAACPTCRQTLTADHLEAMRDDMETGVAQLSARAEEKRGLIERLERELVSLEVRRKACERVRRDLVGVRGRRERLGGRRRELERALAERTTVVEECGALEQRLAAGAYAEDERSELPAVMARRETRAADAARFVEIETEVAALEAKGVVRAYRAAVERRELRAESMRRRKVAADSLAAIDARIASRHEEEARQRAELGGLEEAVTRLEGIEKALAELAERVAGAERERVRLEIEQTRAAERLAGIRSEHERLLALERRRQYLGEVQRWLTAHLVPAIADIEYEVFERLRLRFEALFADWFARLVETDDLEARVDETFSPLLRSGEYDLDLDLDSLSGGERTSLALAYRLALNTMVREEAGMGRDSLLILDEPTDGFSSGQLHRLREILDDTGCDQTIIVSHEQELEGVADRVYGIAKERGTSRVAPLE
jgi:exonuclease SbcC